MKTLIIGNLGSGKTTLAEKIGKMYEIPFFSIDNIVHDDTKNYQGVLPVEGFAVGGTDSKSYVRREIVYVVTLKNIKGF